MSSDLPWLSEDERVLFPSPTKASIEGVIAAGGNLSPGMLLSAYSQGCFPWFNEGEPVLWWNPDPRCVIYPSQIHFSKRTMRRFKAAGFDVSFDQVFEQVINSCAKVGSRQKDGCWISKQFIKAYTKLHELGYAHSVEVWEGDQLVGGLYGVLAGEVFCGESMFSRVSDSSKAALWGLSQLSSMLGIALIDCQMQTPHLESLGAQTIPREQFLAFLGEGCDCVDYKAGKWELDKILAIPHDLIIHDDKIQLKAWISVKKEVQCEKKR